jgi:Mrp family chromosome partitioning ATPase
MSVPANWVESAVEDEEVLDSRVPERTAPPAETSSIWSESAFEEEQVRRLVRQAFFPNTQALRQVALSGVQDDNIGDVCLQVGKHLSAQAEGNVCVVELNLHDRSSNAALGRRTREQAPDLRKLGSLRDSSRQLSRNLWVMPAELFWGVHEAVSSPWVRARLEELRLDFDFLVLHGPPAVYSEATLLAQLSDGMILIFEANSTRRAVAQKVTAMLQASHVRLLGIVLNNRKFPIPQQIYRRL